MTDIQAAIGLKQLERYILLLQRRHEIIKQYDESFDRLGILHLQHCGVDFQSSGHLYLCRIPGVDETKRNTIISELAELGVATNVHYKPLPMMTAYKSCVSFPSDYLNSFNLYKNEISLPLHTLLTNSDIGFVITSIERILR